jgi:5-methylcytosine-specific restriction endonuclease McrA
MSWNEWTKRAVWEKAETFPSLDPARVRLDSYGNVIAWEDYGNPWSDFGWEIDHIIPKKLGGSDEILNLRALQCSVNRSKQDKLPPETLWGAQRTRRNPFPYQE